MQATSPRWRSPELLAALVALSLVLVALGMFLGRSAPRLAASNSEVAASGRELRIAPGDERCQGAGYVPAEAERLRLFVGTNGRARGEPLLMSLSGPDGQIVWQRPVQGGYPPGPLEVDVPGEDRDVEGGTLCITNTGDQTLAFAGNRTPLNVEALKGVRVEEDIRVDYLRGGRESFFEIAPAMARRFALFKPGFVKSWAMGVVLALVVVLWAATLFILIGRRGRVPALGLRSLPKVGWACVVIAAANAALWAVITPAFQVPDEPLHVDYAKYVAETGRLPRYDVPRRSPGAPSLSSEETEIALQGMPWNVEGDPSWSPAADAAVQRLLDGDVARATESGAWRAANYPPLYYGLTAVPARLADQISLFDRLYLMRLVSALLAGATVAFVFLFLRETLPATPWAWPVGSLAVAFQPLFGFMAGGVNNDNLLWTCASALLFLLARAFRGGLTLRLGMALGATAAAGVLTKPSMLGLVPGAALGVAFLAMRPTSPPRKAARRGALAAAVLLAVPVLVWTVVNATVFHRTGSAATGVSTIPNFSLGSVRDQLSYLWQFFLPRLPFMEEQFPGYPSYPVWQVYIQGFLGRFGYFQYGFSPLVNRLGLGALIAVAGLALTGLAWAARSLGSRWKELATYVTVALGVVVVTGLAGHNYRAVEGANFEQTRYLLPLLPLYGAAVAMAARSARGRGGPVMGIVLVTVAMGHGALAMALTITRYYA